jgi:hypothetical protein
MVTCLAPPVAVTPVGAAGTVGAGGFVVAVASDDAELSPVPFTPVTM